jgi:hypothetical protein
MKIVALAVTSVLCFAASREDSVSATGGEETGSQGAGRVVTFTTDNLANRIALLILGGMLRVTRFVLSRDYAEVYLGNDRGLQTRDT